MSHGQSSLCIVLESISSILHNYSELNGKLNAADCIDIKRIFDSGVDADQFIYPDDRILWVTSVVEKCRNDLGGLNCSISIGSTRDCISITYNDSVLAFCPGSKNGVRGLYLPSHAWYKFVSDRDIIYRRISKPDDVTSIIREFVAESKPPVRPSHG